MKLLWVKGKYIQTSSFNLKLFWKKVTYQIWTFQAALRERLIQRKKLLDTKIRNFLSSRVNHELNKIQQWSCLCFTIQNQFVWSSSSVKNWKMASLSWKFYLVSNKFVEFRTSKTWKVLLKNTTTNMCWKTLFFTSSAPLASLLL